VVVISGDFTQRGRAGQYQAAADYLQRLPRPQIVVPGNHDIPLFSRFARLSYPLSNYLHYITPDLQPFFADDQLAILGINTARSWTWSISGFWKDGRISQEQLWDVKRRFCELPETIVKIVVTHHPFIPPPRQRIHGIVRRAAQALNQLESYGVDLLLAGHLHMGYSGDVRTHHEAVKRSILSVQAGTAISTRRRHEPNAYNLITVNPDHVDISVRAWTGQQFAILTETHYSRIDGIWQREG
jgi:3',5'-cyclic AMP phosphodiesterase CpdA